VTGLSEAHFNLNMPSHQLQMYDHASHLDKLLSSDLPVEDVIAQTGQVVVSIPTILFSRHYLIASSEMLLQ